MEIICRSCGSAETEKFVDLGSCPASNSYLTDENQIEQILPLKTFVCKECFLVQTFDTVDRKHFFNESYAYMSSASDSWLLHAEQFSAKVIDQFSLRSSSKVLEIACNDGYLLKNFIKRGILCRGVEPSRSVAQIAKAKGIKVDEEFFGADYYSSDGQYDLIIANNVFAHVPDVNDFAIGIRKNLAKNGIFTIEVHHIANLILENQFDTIYHEHYSYYSLYSMMKVFERVGLRVFDVEEVPTHGGSIRVYGTLIDSIWIENESVPLILEKEEGIGLHELRTYREYRQQVVDTKLEFLKFLIGEKAAGRKTVAYGAAAKGNTLLNYCGVNTDLVEYVFDAAELKIGKFLPGSRLPVLDANTIDQYEFDNLVILPWNISSEIQEKILSLTERTFDLYKVIPRLQKLT